MNATFTIGNVLATSFRVWLRNLVPFLLITAVFYAPPWIWAWLAVHADPSLDNIRWGARSTLIATYLTFPLGVFVSATLTYGVVMELYGQHASIASCIATGLSRFFPALAVGVLSIVCIVGAGITVVGGFVVICMLYVATPVAVLERPGVRRSLSRSNELTNGRKGKIFGLVLLLFALGFGVSWLHKTILQNPAPMTLEAVADNLSRHLYATFVQQVALGSLGAVITSVSYYLLRAEKEGTSAGELAAIFD